MKERGGANGRNALIPINADLHTHAIGDGRFGDATRDYVARHIEAAVEAGLQCIGVTDHDDLRPGLLAAEYAEAAGLALLVLPGMEITTSEGHLVALGLSEPIAAWRSMRETIAEIRARDALCILPHPFFPELRARTDIDAIERLNTRYGDFDVVRDDIAVIASSDAHSAADVRESPYYTRLLVEQLTWGGVVAAIRERRVEIITRHNGHLNGAG
jgi:hypothetical protein